MVQPAPGAAVPRAIPESAEAIAPAWLADVLREAGALAAGRVAEVRAQPIAVGEGFAGRLARLSVTYEGAPAAAPASVIAKFAADHEPTRRMLASLGGYEREVRFYREWAERAGLPTPRCYYAEIDPATATFMILLEDMRPATVGDQVAGASLEQAREVTRLLATFHARWWNDERVLRELRPRAEVLQEVLRLFRAGLPAFRASMSGAYPGLVVLAERLDSIAGELAEDLVAVRRPFTLVHGDVRLDNLFFPTPEGGRFAVIDWQGTAAGQPAADLAYWLVLSLPIELRRARERELLALYHATLVDRGVRGYSLRRLRRDYRRAAMAFVVGAVVLSSNLDLLGPERGRALVDAALRRFEAALDDAHARSLSRLLVASVRARRALRRARLLPGR